MPGKLKCTVIGVGNMGINHVRVYSQLKEAQLVAVADVNKTLAKDVAVQFKTKYYQNFLEMLDAETPDVVSVCVPTSYHFAVAKQCIERKVNILLEKPISTTVKEGTELIKLAKKYHIQLLVGHIERHNPAVKKTKEIIKCGDIGKITSIIARRVGGFPYRIRDANIMVDLAIHDIDIVNYLLDEYPQKITVNKKRIHTKNREDSVEFFLQYGNSSAYIQANWFTPVKIRKLNITGTSGYLEMDYITQKIQFYKSNYKKFKETTTGFSDFILRFSEPDIIDIPVDKKEPLNEEIVYFLHCIQNKQKIDSNFALDALKIALSDEVK